MLPTAGTLNPKPYLRHEDLDQRDPHDFKKPRRLDPYHSTTLPLRVRERKRVRACIIGIYIHMYLYIYTRPIERGNMCISIYLRISIPIEHRTSPTYRQEIKDTQGVLGSDLSFVGEAGQLFLKILRPFSCK